MLIIDNLCDDKFINDDIINKSEKLNKRIKLSLEKGKSINKEWDNNNLNSYLNDCINIENNIKIINDFNESINKRKIVKKTKIKFEPKKRYIK